MEKVRLEIEELRLQSFDTTDDASQHRGTVNGHANPTDEVSCTAGATCLATCAFPCACDTGTYTAPRPSDACSDDERAQELGYATFMGSGG